MIKFKNKKTLYFKLCVYFSTLITAVCMLSIGIIYFWSYYYFSNIFEDKVIEMHTHDSNQSLHVKDEWILGVTAHSIDLVEAIHGEEIADRVYEDAKNQLVRSKLYKEKIADKYLMYMIDIDQENGEQVYKYSIIKDIYREVFPKILVWFLISVVFVFSISIYIIRIICRHLTSDINQIGDYANKIAHKDWTEQMEISTDNEDILSLVRSFDGMRKKLVERDKLQQSVLQYISHELKTPIMIISSYIQAAKENIYPNGNLNSTLDTVLEQTNRMENKVKDLLFIAELDKEQEEQDKKNLSQVNLGLTIQKIMENFKAIKDSKTNVEVILNLDADLDISGYEDKISVAFENIIENQLRYAEKRIIVRSIIASETIRILFYNDGEKIDDRHINYIFKPFEKGLNGNYGLGMSICKKIFQLHNGDITFIPTVKGCMFKVELPK
ncbi:two-component system, OmpR family, sensor histidine kinase CssS [Peptoclostridium litorale DSM 5388]|uniref:histidine kinase n=1 Tax=Peptoclostridium litorale DSM 5388 TaxID=1121324 RepID=A0A069RCN2_PEPLI|nr:HAMP domain-containing sensor histidine kinase [Peptoclostridium litorale]KDR94000.1 sensor histidine kinase CssS [Peptoclostridium litorale DSM 5388]SIN79357.1 two-component system, OmpR family, sensor histidine kinase CssS [Peptoclostridium litorale DSM 5388]